jgi:hypothetical protein
VPVVDQVPTGDDIMQVHVDSHALAVTELGLETVGDVLQHIRTSNRLVTHVTIDGQTPDLGHMKQVRRHALRGHTIFFETTEPKRIVDDVIDEIERQMDQAEQTRELAINDLSASQPTKALQKLSGCFTTWHAAQQAIDKVAQLLRVDLNLVRLGDDMTLQQSLEQFAVQLKAIRQAVEARDYVSLADILQYEIGRTVSQWRDALTQLKAIVA